MSVGSTQIQGAVTGALSQLGLEHDPVGVPGGQVNLKITDATVKKLQELVGKVVAVQSSGDIKFE